MAYVRTPGPGQPVQPRERGHKPTPSQESNTLSHMSEVSCYTTVSSDSDWAESYEAGSRTHEDHQQPQVVVHIHPSH